MSLNDQIPKHPDKIQKKILDYADYAVKSESFFIMENKKLEHICMAHSKNVYETSRRISELKAIEEYYATVLGKIESAHWKTYNEGYKRALSTRDIQAYIAGEDDYVAAKELSLEVAYVRNQLEHILDALNGMSFMINNITKIRVSELEEVVL